MKQIELKVLEAISGDEGKEAKGFDLCEKCCKKVLELRKSNEKENG